MRLEAEEMGNAPSLGIGKPGLGTAIRTAAIKRLETETGSGLRAGSERRRSLQKICEQNQKKDNTKLHQRSDRSEMNSRKCTLLKVLERYHSRPPIAKIHK